MSKTNTIVKINKFGENDRCSNGCGSNVGHHNVANTSWSRFDKMFHTAFPVGSHYTMDAFQRKFAGTLIAAGHDEDYAKKMASLNHLENGPVFNGTIELIEVIG